MKFEEIKDFVLSVIKEELEKIPPKSSSRFIAEYPRDESAPLLQLQLLLRSAACATEILFMIEEIPESTYKININRKLMFKLADCIDSSLQLRTEASQSVLSRVPL